MTPTPKSTPATQAPRLTIENFAQIDRVDLEFGDLTVLVGPQGTGKSLALQWLKLALDEREIAESLREAGFDLGSAAEAVDAYFGEGMRGALMAEPRATHVTFDGRRIKPESLIRKNGRSSAAQRSLFFVPAHRALLLTEGWPAPFMKLNADVPLVARLFSQALYEQLSERGVSTLFPRERVLMKDLRDRLDDAVFHGGEVRLEKDKLRKRLTLSYPVEGAETSLPFMTWTAGQRELTPLMLGLYPLLPGAQSRKVDGLDWVVLEEPEMGLHPRAIIAVMLLVIEMLWRGYRVVLSTHSPAVLDVVWALHAFKKTRAPAGELAKALGLPSQASRPKVAAAIRKQHRVFALAHDLDGRVRSQDISGLDPGAESDAEADWGGLTQFGSTLSQAVARAYAGSE